MFFGQFKYIKIYFQLNSQKNTQLFFFRFSKKKFFFQKIFFFQKTQKLKKIEIFLKKKKFHQKITASTIFSVYIHIQVPILENTLSLSVGWRTLGTCPMAFKRLKYSQICIFCNFRLLEAIGQIPRVRQPTERERVFTKGSTQTMFVTEKIVDAIIFW